MARNVPVKLHLLCDKLDVNAHSTAGYFYLCSSHWVILIAFFLLRYIVYQIVSQIFYYIVTHLQIDPEEDQGQSVWKVSEMIVHSWICP